MKKDHLNVRKYFRLLTFALIIASFLFILSVFLFSVLANEVIMEKEDQFDMNIYQAMVSFASPEMTMTAKFITFFGSLYFIVPAYIFMILFLVSRKNIMYSILVTVLAIVSLLSGLVFKEIFHRPRPLLPLIPGVNGHSFPSGHSLNGFTFCGVLAYVVWKSGFRIPVKQAAIAFLFTLGILIGLSRVYLRVHYASDVIGSLLLTTTWLSLSFMTIRIVENRMK